MQGLLPDFARSNLTVKYTSVDDLRDLFSCEYIRCCYTAIQLMAMSLFHGMIVKQRIAL
jgi:hypothetical protein